MGSSHRAVLLCSVVATLTLAAPAPDPDTGLPSLVVLSLQPAAGVDPAVANALTEAITREVAALKFFKVISTSEVATLLGIERQKQLLGCGETTCATELVDALGARFVMSGSLTKLGSALQLNLQTLDSKKGAALGRATRVATSLEVLSAQLPFAVAEATALPPPQRPSRVPAVLTMSAGGAGVIVGGVLWLQSLTREEAALAQLTLAKSQPNLVLGPAEQYRAEAKAITELRIAGSIAAGVGAALLVAGVLLLPGDNAVVRLTMVPTPSGVAFAGVFP